jgi:lipoate-protein ligase A
VLHDRCLTYALIAPVEVAPFAGGVRASAERIGSALVAGLCRLGVTLATARPSERGRYLADCFSLPAAGEVVAGARKLAGSAQVRRGVAALQHGTIRLRSDAGDATPLLRRVAPDGRAGSPTALDALCGRPVTFTEAAQAVMAGIAETFGMALRGAALTVPERQRAIELERERYRSDSWTWGR